MSQSDRLGRQVSFIREIDKVKNVFRQTYLLDQSRKENDAEHSWHLAAMVMVLAEYAAASELDLPRVLKMVLIHDLVEIDAGDTFCYDEQAAKTQRAREHAAAQRIFNILPPDQAEEIFELFGEFEAQATPEAKYAASLDRLQPLLHNLYTEGRAWREHGVTVDKVLARNKHIADGAPALWDMVKVMIQEAVDKGHLAPAP